MHYNNIYYNYYKFYNNFKIVQIYKVEQLKTRKEKII